MTNSKPRYLPSVGRLLGFASADCGKLSDRRLKEFDLTLQQWIPLTALWRSRPLSETELATYCRMSAPSVNRLIDRMEAKRLVRRLEDSSDRRRVLVDLGPRGRKLAHLVDFFSEINAVLTAGMTAAERKQLVSLLDRVVANVENALEDPGHGAK